MTYNPTPEGPTTHSHTTPTMWGHLKQVSWGAIFAGVAVALVVQVLLTLLGVGIGAATLDPGTADNPAASTFSVVSAIWYACLLYTSPSPRDRTRSRMPSSA